MNSVSLKYIEHGPFTPLVMSVTGGLGRAATEHLGLIAVYQMGSALFHYHGTATLSPVIFPAPILHLLHQGSSFLIRPCCQIHPFSHGSDVQGVPGLYPALTFRLTRLLNFYPHLFCSLAIALCVYRVFGLLLVLVYTCTVFVIRNFTPKTQLACMCVPATDFHMTVHVILAFCFSHGVHGQLNGVCLQGEFITPHTTGPLFLGMPYSFTVAGSGLHSGG